MHKLFALSLLCILALPVMAQDKVEIFGGYQYLHNGNVTTNGVSQPGTSQGYNGWNAAAAFKLNRFAGVEGDFSGTYASIAPGQAGSSNLSVHIYTYTAGPVLFVPAPFIRPFVHALVGGIHMTQGFSGVSASLNGFTTMIGGGVDAKIAPRIAVRIAQVDWLYYHFGSTTVGGAAVPSISGSNNVRISTGIVLRF